MNDSRARQPAIRKIAQIGHPVLRKVAEAIPPSEIGSPQIQELIDDMIATMRDATGAGLAAPQVFESVRICVIEVKANARYPYKPDIPLTVLVNPELTFLTEETFENYEGCLSVPNLRGVVHRRAELHVRALDRFGVPFERTVRGISAGTYQHEVDHLDATVFIDRVKDPTTFSTWNDFDRFHKDAFVEKARAIVARYGS